MYMKSQSNCKWRFNHFAKILIIDVSNFSISFDRVDNDLSNNVNQFFNFSLVRTIEVQCVFWCSDYSVQKRLQSLWNRKSLESFLKKSFVLFQGLGSYYFGSLKDGVHIVWWVIEAINCGCANVGRTVSLVSFLLKFD